jgi:threonine/homoserine/homoserine lactone efflux protein
MISTLLPFTAFAIAASATPGPNNVMVMAEGATYGFRATIPHVLGIAIGFGLMVLIVGTGLAGPLATYKPLHDILRWIGIAWMVVLAWKIAKSSGPDTDEKTAKPPMGFIGACGFQWINPKAWVGAVATAATYTTNDGNLFAQVGVLALIFTMVCIPCAGGWAALGAGAGRILATPGRLKVFNVTMAVLLLLSVIPMLRE